MMGSVTLRASEDCVVSFEDYDNNVVSYIVYNLYPGTAMGTVGGSGMLFADEDVYMPEAVWLMVKCFNDWPLEMTDPGLHQADPAQRTVMVWCSAMEYQDSVTEKWFTDRTFIVQLRDVDSEGDWCDDVIGTFGAATNTPSWEEAVELGRQKIDRIARQVS